MTMLRELREGEENRLRNPRSRYRKLRAYAVRLSDMFKYAIDPKTNLLYKRQTWSTAEVTGDTKEASQDVREAIIAVRRAIKRLRNALSRYRELRSLREQRLRSGRLICLGNSSDEPKGDVQPRDTPAEDAR